MINWPDEIKFVKNKYSKWYNSLIQKAQQRETLSGYKENHHIVPRSLGGSNDNSNIVSLTAREHYIAHALLWKMNFEGKYGHKMVFALAVFINKVRTSKVKKNFDYAVNSRIYESFRKHQAEISKITNTGKGNPFYEKTHSEAARKVIGEKSKLKEFKKGPEHPMWGRSPSPEARAKSSASMKEKWKDPEWKKNQMAKYQLARQRPEVIANRKAATDARRGVKRDPAAVEKTAAKKRGKKEHEIYSSEAILKRKEALKNRVLSEKGREKIKEAGRKRKGVPKKKKLCPKCGGMFAGNMLARYHGDNCDALERNKKSNELKKPRKGAALGKTWFNNGQIETYKFECPVGFTKGRLKKKPNSENG